MVVKESIEAPNSTGDLKAVASIGDSCSAVATGDNKRLPLTWSALSCFRGPGYRKLAKCMYTTDGSRVSICVQQTSRSRVSRAISGLNEIAIPKPAYVRMTVNSLHPTHYTFADFLD